MTNPDREAYLRYRRQGRDRPVALGRTRSSKSVHVTIQVPHEVYWRLRDRLDTLRTTQPIYSFSQIVIDHIKKGLK